MKLKFALFYSSVIFLSIYVLLSVSLRILKLVEDYYAHVFAGVIGMLVAMILFIVIITKKEPKKSKTK